MKKLLKLDDMLRRLGLTADEWAKMQEQDKCRFPKPVDVCGVPYWRTADLCSWLRSLPCSDGAQVSEKHAAAERAQESCQRCKHWVRDVHAQCFAKRGGHFFAMPPSGWGLCCANPPVPARDDKAPAGCQDLAVWPITLETRRCGAFAAKSKAGANNG